MTPQGHMFAGWITFSATEVDGDTVAQAQVLMRASDPIFELGLTLGGHKQEDRFWQHTLTALAAHFEPRGRRGHPGRVRRQASASGRGGATCGTAPPSARRSTRSGAPGRAREAPVQARSRGCLSPANDAVVVGSGPNGLAAAIVLARAGRRVTVLEGAETIGGGCRSEELTLPGFVHDTCSTVHALALASPVPEQPAAGRARPRAGPSRRAARAPARRRHGRAARALRRGDGGGLGPDARGLPPAVRAARAHDADELMREILGPLRPPRHPLVLARFGAERASARRWGWRGRASRASALAPCWPAAARTRCSRCARPASAAFGIVLMLSAHHVGWPVARGGSQRLADALAVAPALARRRDRDGQMGGVARRARRLRRDAARRDAAPARCGSPATACRPATPAGSGATATGRASSSSTGRSTAPIPWTRAGGRPRGHGPPRRHARARSPPRRRRPSAASTPSARSSCSCSRASSTRPARPRASTRPGPTATCRTARPADMTEAIEAQVERFAPGFRDLIAARSAMDAAEMERRNPNYVGGDINGGVQDLRQLFTRPVARAGPVLDAGRRALPLLVVDAAGRRRARHVRVLRGPRGPAQAP